VKCLFRTECSVPFSVEVCQAAEFVLA